MRYILPKLLIHQITQILLILLLGSGCGLLAQENSAPTDLPPVEVFIRLERTACHGTCPIYILTISGDGRVVYDGIDFVAVKGRQTTTIAPEQVQALVEAFTVANFFLLEDHTEYVVADAASAILSLTIGEQMNTVEHYYGDDSAPPILFELETLVDELANSKQWIDP